MQNGVATLQRRKKTTAIAANANLEAFIVSLLFRHFQTTSNIINVMQRRYCVLYNYE